MNGLRSKVKMACENILGKDVYDAMASARISLPSIMDQAVRISFMEGYNNEDTDTLREAMRKLSQDGILED